MKTTTNNQVNVVPMQKGKTIAEVKSVINDKNHGIIRTRVTTGDCCS